MAARKPTAWRSAACLALVWSLVAGTAFAHDATAKKPAGAIPAAAASLRLDAEPAPLAAMFSVTVTPPRGAKSRAEVRHHDWYFFRDAQRVSLLKGEIDESWHRDAAGRLSFERVFHADRHAVDYSAGELATIGVQAQWADLAHFVDAAELASLAMVSRTGRGASERLRLETRNARGTVRIDWMPALQLPALVLRTDARGGSTRIALVQHAPAAPAAWPVPGQRSADYTRLDAADFGDMDYEPVVRKAEAIDVRGGWRTAHQHD